MAKQPVGSLNRDAIQKRIRDEMAQPGVDILSPTGHRGTPIEELPQLSDLGLPLSIRKKLETLTADHAELGRIERGCKKDREKLTAQIKGLLAEHVPDDVPSFVCGDSRVTRFTQNRPTFDKDACVHALLGLGVKPRIITEAMQQATTIKPVHMLKISPVGEAEE